MATVPSVIAGDHPALCDVSLYAQLPAPEVEGWPTPEPLAESLPDVAQFDLELMPESFRPLVKDVAERMQVPLDFPAVAAIATLAGVTNRRALIQPKRNDHTWTVVPNLWGGIVAPPGMLKSPVLTCMTQPARAIENEWRKAHEDANRDYQNTLEMQELRLRRVERTIQSCGKRTRARNSPLSRNRRSFSRCFAVSSPAIQPLRNFTNCYQKIRRGCFKSGMS